MKKWYLSKTLWLNALGAAIAIVQGIQGQSWINPELQVLILTVLNAALRFSTNQAISK